MKTKIFRVRFSANYSDSNHPGYRNGFEAFDNSSTYMCAILNSPGEYTISERYVRSESATGACLKFQNWQNNGKQVSWLLSES